MTDLVNVTWPDVAALALFVVFMLVFFWLMLRD